MITKTNPQPVVNQLTTKEVNRVIRLYPSPPKGSKLELNQIQYMPDNHVYMICYWYDDAPFQGTKQQDWVITRDSTEIKVFNKGKGHAYVIDIHNGDVNILRGGMRSHLGTGAYAFQFHMEHCYAFPLFFGKGHWANGKNALQLGVAVPNMQPMYDALYMLFDKDEDLAEDWLFNKKLHNIDLYNVDVFNNELTEIKKQIARKG